MMALETERPPVAVTTEGQPNSVGATGQAPFAHTDTAGKAGDCSPKPSGGNVGNVAYRAVSGRIWHYSGKRGRVLSMLATMPAGLTQWDTLPWHTRLSGTIHAMREDGLTITTKREGEYRHARYRLATPGSLMKQVKNREAGQ